jgi:hypothetical protein
MLNPFWGASQWHNIRNFLNVLKSFMWFENNLDRVFETWSISFIVVGPCTIAQVWSSQVYILSRKSNCGKNIFVFFDEKANIMANARISIHFLTWCERANQKINIMNSHLLIEMVLINWSTCEACEHKFLLAQVLWLEETLIGWKNQNSNL